MQELVHHLFENKFKGNKVFFDVEAIKAFANKLPKLLFPQRNERVYNNEEELLTFAKSVKHDLCSILHNLRLDQDKDFDREEICRRFFERLFDLEKMLAQDAEAIVSGDPATDSKDEVIISYPGFFAICIYRFAHEFYKMSIPILPRILTEHAHQLTGIDIHPGAKIGSHFFIDHGTGIVIGETTIIGNHVKIYQGVTLGALSVKKEIQGQKRHPTIEDHVIIYSNATILGGKTIIGRNSVIGGNVWLTDSVPVNSRVYHKSEIRLASSNQ